MQKSIWQLCFSQDKDVANEQIKKLSREKDSLDRHVADMEKEMADMKEQVRV